MEGSSPDAPLHMPRQVQNVAASWALHSLTQTCKLGGVQCNHFLQTLYMVRHGESEYNAASMTKEGFSDPQVYNPKLTAKGRKQVPLQPLPIPSYFDSGLSNLPSERCFLGPYCKWAL